VIDHHLPALQIVVPLMAAPLCVLIKDRLRALVWSIAVCWVSFAMASRLLYLVGQAGVLSYEMGGWPAPYGIVYRVDALSAFIVWLVAGMGALVISFAPRSLDREIRPEHQTYFLTLYLLCLTGLMGIAITGDLFNLFVFLEISSLSSYAIISLGKTRRALVASFQYLVMGTIGATFILIGIGLSYQVTGSLNMMDLAGRLTQYTGQGHNRTVLVAFAFFSVGISLKMALFPLHQWLPNAYAYAPSVVTAFLAATGTKVSVYVLLRIIFTIFQPRYAFGNLSLNVGLTGLALIGIYGASLAAMFQKDVKRLLAYSSIAQVGYIVLGISLATPTGVTAGVLHVFNHALTKGGLFMAMGCFAVRLPSLQIDDLRGIGRRMPWTTFAWVLGGLGLIGVPFTSGFISKWYLLEGTLELGHGWLAGALLVGSLLAVVYVWRVVEAAYFGQSSTEGALATEAPLQMLIPTYLVVGASVLFGVWTEWPTQLARDAAQALLGNL
jgi:multicomponent Na+:H+ antiporter subunit D